MDENKTPNEANGDESQNGDGERTLEEVNAELAKLQETNENLNKALKEARGKNKESKPEDNKPEVDVNAVVKRTLKIENLANKYNGEDEKPKFDEEELKQYAEENNLPYGQIDPELVYEMKHRATLSDIGNKATLKKNKGVIMADGKPVTVKTMKGKIGETDNPNKLVELMQGVGGQ